VRILDSVIVLTGRVGQDHPRHAGRRHRLGRRRAGPAAAVQRCAGSTAGSRSRSETSCSAVDISALSLQTTARRVLWSQPETAFSSWAFVIRERPSIPFRFASR
jgi:hypothetical protein